MWAKKHQGRLFCFGPWADPQAALREYQQWLDQNQGNPASMTQGRGTVTVADLVNTFLAAKDALRQSGELAPRSFASLHLTSKYIAEYFGRNRDRSRSATPCSFD